MSRKENSPACPWNWLLSVALVAMVGCNGSPGSPATENGQSNSPESTEMQPKQELIASVDVQRKLVGAWLGSAFLDEQRLVEKLESLPDDRQTAALNLADEFLTTEVAMELRQDGSLELEIEVTPFGRQPLRDGGVGNWQIVETSADQVLVEMQTTLSNGEVTTDRHRFRFYPDGNKIAQLVPLGADLDPCNPLIILQRQPLSPTNMAEQAAVGVLK